MASASFSGFNGDCLTEGGTSNVGYLTVISLWKFVIPEGDTLVKSASIQRFVSIASVRRRKIA